MNRDIGSAGAGLLIVMALLVAPGTLWGECSSFVAEPMVNNFVLVVDRSGSMNSDMAIDDAKAALEGFVRRANPEDRIGMVSFAEDLKIEHEVNSDRSGLIRRIHRLRAGGGTHLYDAVASAIRMLSGSEGLKVIVFLTDGDDNGSLLTVSELRQMNVGENVFVYGLGLGNVNHGAISGLSEATSGEYSVARSSRDLTGLYETVQANHYSRVENRLRDNGAITVTSIPPGRDAFLDGRRIGRTPVRVDDVPPGDYRVTVAFERGEWSCTDSVRRGYRNLYRARESDVPADLIIESAPTRAAAFVNGAYVGLTSMTPSGRTANGGVDYSNQMRIESIPRGTHRVKLVAAPESPMAASGLGSSQILEFTIAVTDRDVYVKGLIFMGQVQFEDGSTQQVRSTVPGPTPGGSNDPIGDGIPDNFPGALFGN